MVEEVKGCQLEVAAPRYEKVSDVVESKVFFACKNLIPRRMHQNGFLIGQIIAKCHSFPNMYDML